MPAGAGPLISAAAGKRQEAGGRRGGRRQPRDGRSIARAIRELADDSYQVRERASKDLLAMGPKIRPRIEKALAVAVDAERRYRLRSILLTWDPPPADLDDGLQPVPFGSAAVTAVRRLFQDSAGRIYAVAQSIRRDETHAGPGIAILDRGNQTRVVLHSDLALAEECENLPLQDVVGNRLWWPCTQPPGTLRLLDLHRGEFIDATPLSGAVWPQAVDADGRLFLAGVDKLKGQIAVMAYASGAPEKQFPLKLTSIPVGGHSFVVRHGGHGLGNPSQGWPASLRWVCWEPLARQPPGEIRSLIAGDGGIVLVRSVESGAAANQDTLYRGEQYIASAQANVLIKQNHGLFSKAFGPGCPLTLRCPLAAYNAGNVWYSDEQGRVLVLVGDQWHSAAEAIVAARLPQFRPSLICPVGGGRAVYLADMERRQGCLGSVERGQIHCKPVPGIIFADVDPRIVRDAEGAVWLFARPGLVDGDGSFIDHPTIVRLGAEGVRERLPLFGAPYLIDATSAIWLGRAPLESSEVFNVLRSGKLLQKIRVPHLHARWLLVSDRPGSVYVLTTMGLQHLVADPPAFDRYRLGTTYSIDEVAGEIIEYGCSKHGHLLLSVRQNGPTQTLMLHSVRLPNE